MSNVTNPSYAGDPNCFQSSSCRGMVSGGSTDSDGDIRDTANTLWHHYLVTTRPGGGKGYNVYIDGVLRSADPYIEGIGIDRGTPRAGGTRQVTGGSPTDPEGPIRLCGRQYPGYWAGDTRDVLWNERRYFLGKVAHFAVWDSAMTAAQVNSLHNSYVTMYNIPQTPFLMPTGVPQPLAYYYLDEGAGFDLKESVAGNRTAGHVTYEDDHQITNYTNPNWGHDEYFGRALSCGRADTWQKDTLSLADVDYGHSGSWTMSVWFRHDDVNFPGYQREQFIGHGNPIAPTSSNNQFHVQMERSEVFRTIMRDSTDIDRCATDRSNPPIRSCVSLVAIPRLLHAVAPSVSPQTRCRIPTTPTMSATRTAISPRRAVAR